MLVTRAFLPPMCVPQEDFNWTSDADVIWDWQAVKACSGFSLSGFTRIHRELITSFGNFVVFYDRGWLRKCLFNIPRSTELKIETYSYNHQKNIVFGDLDMCGHGFQLPCQFVFYYSAWILVPKTIFRVFKLYHARVFSKCECGSVLYCPRHRVSEIPQK